MKKPPQKESIAERTRAYIDTHPSVKDCVAKDLINYSSLARQIMRELDIKNEEAVMIACRRYSVKLGSKDHEREILSILKDSRLEMKTKICIVTAKNDWAVLHQMDRLFKDFLNDKSIMQVIQSTSAITIIADEKLKDKVTDSVGKFNVLNIRDGLVEIAVKSPESIVATSGVFSYLVDNLSESGVNIEEAVSCHTDTIFIVSEDDMITAYSVLSGCIQSAEDSLE